MHRVVAGPLDAIDQAALHRFIVGRKERVEERHIDTLTASGSLTLEKCRANCPEGGDAGDHIGNRDAGAGRNLRWIAVHRLHREPAGH